MVHDFKDMDAWLTSAYEPTAVYFADADCVEYVKEDTTSVYRRIDRYLTLILDETGVIPIGFKLKGFRNLFERLRESQSLDGNFVDLVCILERLMTDVGNESFRDAEVSKAYIAARKIGQGVKLYDLPEAA